MAKNQISVTLSPLLIEKVAGVQKELGVVKLSEAIRYIVVSYFEMKEKEQKVATEKKAK